MNGTDSTQSPIIQSNNTEMMIFVILIKLTILFVYKLANLCIKVYKKHNTKVIQNHMKAYKDFNTSEAAQQTAQSEIP